MLAEAIEWLLTPASPLARRMGYLSETIAIMARERRCREGWRPHLEASRRALLDSAMRQGKRRVALVLGSGPLLDVPLAELSALFEAVWLVDMVHPWRARRLARQYANVRLIKHDITESLAGRTAGPRRFLDEPRIDWVASVNMLSQLPGPSVRRPDDSYSGPILEHLDYLSRFAARVCLLADLEQVTLDASGGAVGQVDFGPLLAGWRISREWRWDIAPPGELSGGLTRYHRVAALERPQHEDQGDVRQAQA